MNKLDTEDKINQIITENNLNQKLFLVNKEILDIFFQVLDMAQSFIPTPTESEYYKENEQKINSMLRASRDLTSSIYYDRKDQISNGVYYIDNIFRELHPSYKIDLTTLRNNLKIAYLNYSYQITSLLEFFSERFISNYREKLNSRITYTREEKTYNLNIKVTCKQVKTLEEVLLNIDVNGNIEVQFDNKKENFKFKVNDHPLTCFDRDIKDFFKKKINTLNFQYIIDEIEDKSLLYEQEQLIRGEAIHAKVTLENYKKYGFNIIQINK